MRLLLLLALACPLIVACDDGGSSETDAASDTGAAETSTPDAAGDIEPDSTEPDTTAADMSDTTSCPPIGPQPSAVEVCLEDGSCSSESLVVAFALATPGSPAQRETLTVRRAAHLTASDIITWSQVNESYTEADFALSPAAGETDFPPLVLDAGDEFDLELVYDSQSFSDEATGTLTFTSALGDFEAEPDTCAPVLDPVVVTIVVVP